jgi:hypothetical protein
MIKSVKSKGGMSNWERIWPDKAKNMGKQQEDLKEQKNRIKLSVPKVEINNWENVTG